MLGCPWADAGSTASCVQAEHGLVSTDSAHQHLAAIHVEHMTGDPAPAASTGTGQRRRSRAGGRSGRTGSSPGAVVQGGIFGAAAVPQAVILDRARAMALTRIRSWPAPVPARWCSATARPWRQRRARHRTRLLGGDRGQVEDAGIAGCAQPRQCQREARTADQVRLAYQPSSSSAMP